MICEELKRQGLQSFITVNAQPNGEGDATYPEPRQIYLHYKSVFDKEITYLRPDIVLEVSARSLLEPTEYNNKLKVLLESIFRLHHWLTVPFILLSLKDIP